VNDTPSMETSKVFRKCELATAAGVSAVSDAFHPVRMLS
jgi:hypothetical protein